ncbi:MAG: hypothetical protein R3A48_08640 [Polyangiales bacterium]
MSDRRAARAASRLARIHQCRGMLAPADALHLARGCARCGAAALDARAMDAWLAPDGVTPVASTGALHALLASLDGDLPAAPCACGEAAPMARYYHAMGRGDLVVERGGGEERLAVMFLDGSEAPVRGALEAVFGRPLSTRAGWLEALAAAGDARVEVEEGHWLLASDDPSGLAAPAVGAAVLGVDAGALATPAWRWLLEALAAGEHRGRALALAVRRDVLFDALSRAMARVGAVLEGAPASPRWRASRGELGCDLEVDAALRAMVRHDLPLTAYALRAAADLDARLDAVTRYVSAARSARPAAALEVEGDRLVGPSGRSLDLATAPFEAELDGEALERDLRVLLDEAPSWSHGSRVCPCGAGRSLVSRLLPGEALAALQREGRAPLVRRRWESGGALRAFEVISLECDRHRAPLTRAELDAWGWSDARLEERLDRDAGEATFFARVASWRDGSGRGAALAQGPDLGGATLRDDWTRALAALADPPLDPSFVQATSPHAVIAWESDVDPALVERVRGVDAMLDPMGAREGEALTPPRAVTNCAPRGRFVRLEPE